jgi:5'-AMP-activated protein kinase catalytic alpha subunit
MVEAKQSYNPLQVDLWSCGVVLFAMLCGHLPFCDVDTHTLFKKILACTYKIPTHVSPDAQDLIQRLLVLDPEKRISIEEIREHKWFNRVSPAAAYGIDLG